MAVPAVDAVVARVMLMRELHGLLARDEGPRVVRRTLDFSERPRNEGENDDRAVDANLGNRVRAAMKNLRQSYPSTCPCPWERVSDLRTLARPVALCRASEVLPRTCHAGSKEVINESSRVGCRQAVNDDMQ